MKRLLSLMAALWLTAPTPVLAEQLVQRPPLVLRYSRVLLTQHVKRLMHDMLGYGLALEGLGVVDAKVAPDS